MNDEATEKARAEGVAPVKLTESDIRRFPDGITILSLGDHCPSGYRRVSLEKLGHADLHGVYMGDNQGFGAYFVDASGFGSPGEPALTLEQFRDVLIPGYYYAVVEAGEFQVKVGVFERI
jgi:hypothetical protein